MIFDKITPQKMNTSACFNHRVIENDKTRRFDHGSGDHCDGSGNDGQWQGSGWYRFVGSAGTRLTERKVSNYHCGTSAPMWLSGKHPNSETIFGSYKEMTACSGNSYCDYSTEVKIMNCGDFFVYKLKELRCNRRYCIE